MLVVRMLTCMHHLTFRHVPALAYALLICAGAHTSSPNAAAIHDLDVTHVALVAAQTWLLQALTKITSQRGKQGLAPSAIPPSNVLTLLHSLPRLKVRLHVAPRVVLPS